MDKNETGISAAFISLSDCAPILHEEILRSNLHNFLFIQYKEIKYIVGKMGRSTLEKNKSGMGSQGSYGFN